MDDVHAVMDAAGSNRATLIGVSEGVPMSIVFAATYPERVRASSHGRARPLDLRGRLHDRPPAEAFVESGAEFVLPYWGQGTIIEIAAPSQADNAEAKAFFGRMERATSSPGCSPSSRRCSWR